jgi:DNA-binding transcriptional LysR family regulator
MKTSFRQLTYVATAARLCNISQAAKALNISTSSVLAAIDKAEQEFGVTIFVRQKAKGLTITHTGRQIVSDIEGLLEEVNSFNDKLAGLGSKLTGDLHVGCFHSVSPHLLPAIMGDLARDHPGISIHLHEGDVVEIQDLLRDGSVDVTISYDFDTLDNMVKTTLTNVPPHVAVAQSSPLSSRSSVSLGELRDLPMILLDLPVSRIYVPSLFEEEGFQPRIVYRTRVYETVRSLVAENLGFAIMNLRPLIDHTYGGRKVVCLPIEGKNHGPNLVISRRPDAYATRIVQVFTEYCQNYFDSECYAGYIVRKEEER